MIQLSCRCSFVLDVPADQAGLTVQCPQCGRLNDVPNLGDLPNLDKDGGYKIVAPLNRDEPNRLADLNQAFSRQRTVEIDMRGPVNAGLNQGDNYPAAPPRLITGGPPPDAEIPMAAEVEPTPPPRPRYDPETGELIVALDVRVPAPEPPPPKPLPMATMRNLAAEDLANSPQGLKVLLELFRPLNVLVMCLFTLAVSALIAVDLCMAIFPPIIPLFGIIVFLLLMFSFSHIANVIEETGPMAKDELPRPLRDANLGDDVWFPFLRFLGSLLTAYLPYMVWIRLPVLAWISGRAPSMAWAIDAVREPVAWSLLGLGTAMFPAILLTLCTSGGIINLRPDRVIGVIRCAGFVDYATALLLWGTIILLPWLILMALGPVSNITILLIAVVPTATAYSVLGHGLAWLLGSIYRRHHDEFPWAYQIAEHRQRFGFPVMRAPKPPAPPTGFPVGPVAQAPAPAQRPASRQPEIR